MLLSFIIIISIVSIIIVSISMIVSVTINVIIVIILFGNPLVNSNPFRLVRP